MFIRSLTEWLLTTAITSPFKMARQKKEEKGRKIREISQEIKKFEAKQKNESALEKEVENSNLQNFTRFVKSSSGNIVPVLESGQVESTPVQPVRRTVSKPIPSDDRSPYISTPQSFYFTSTPATQSERAKLYKPLTEVNSAPTLRQERIIQPQQSQFGNILEPERNKLSDDSDRKYKSAVERGREKGKPKYDWE